MKKRSSILFLIIAVCLLCSCDINVTSEYMIETSAYANIENDEDSDYVYGNYLKPIEGLEPLTKEFYDLFKNNLNHSYYSDRYLGTFSGCPVLFDVPDPGELGSDGFCFFTISGYDFYYSQGFSIRIYSGKECWTLKDGYEKGLLNDVDIETLYCRNNEYMLFFKPHLDIVDKKPITEEELQNINKAWEQLFGAGEKYADSLDMIQLGHSDFCYGKFGNNIVFRDRNKDALSNADYRIEIGDSIFVCPPIIFQIWVYRDENIYSLLEAFNNSLVTADEIKYISYMNCYSNVTYEID